MPDFRFRLPSINELTPAQQIAYYEKKPMLITGGPGSGKTVVSIFRYLRHIQERRTALFFTFNRTLMSAIRGTIRQKADLLLPSLNKDQVEQLLSANIGSFFEWYGAQFHLMLSAQTHEEIELNFQNLISSRKRGRKFDDIVFDESQDLKPSIIQLSAIIAETVSCGADRAQDLQGHFKGPADDVIFELLNKQHPTVRQELTQNFRNTREIFEFARQFVPEDAHVQALDTSELANGEKPDIRAGLQETDQLRLILEIIQQYGNSNIGILVHTKKEIIRIKEFLEQKGYSCHNNQSNEKSFSYYYSGMDGGERDLIENHLKSPFVLSFESCKGLEFDIVVMPFFDKSSWALGNYKPNNSSPEQDAKGNPKRWATPNHYYVAATRARSQLFIFFDRTPGVLHFWTAQKTNDLNTSLFDLPF